jgi:Bax protein
LAEADLSQSALNQADESTTLGEKPRLAPFHPPHVSLGDSNLYSPPDFSVYPTVQQRKQAFYDYLLPKIHQANDEVLLERAWLLQLADDLVEGREPGDLDDREISRMERRYRIRSPKTNLMARLSVLIEHVDTVPASLVLAQAAKESGWGTSRFATQGNNFFGIWCFTRGCGLRPLDRDDGLTHEVGTFDSVADGVRYYIRTINSHSAYGDLRALRARVRRANERPAGEALASGLSRYSERGIAYVREIQSMIRYNQLSRFTRA